MKVAGNTLLILLTLFFYLGCGRIIEESEADSGKPRGQRAERDNKPVVIPSDDLKKQKLVCDDFLFCPESFSRLIITEGNSQKECLGTLIDKNKVLTSASCLPKSLRIPQLKCDGKIFAQFASTAFAPEELVSCKKIEYVDSDFIGEPALWQSDFAIIELRKKVNRETSYISPYGIEDNENLSVWGLKKESESVSVIYSKECKSILNSYLNPLSDNAFSSMFVTSKCDLSKNEIGAPIFRGLNLVGMFSREMKKNIYNYLSVSDIMNEKLSRYYHVSNVSCGKFNEVYSGFPAHKNCFVKKTTKALDRGRANILKSIDVHESSMQKIKAELERPEKFFIWNVQFQVTGRQRTMEAHFGKPKCIYDIKKWIKRYRYRTYTGRRRIRDYANRKIKTPRYILTTMLNTDLKPVSVVSSDDTKVYEVEFNPKDAYFNDETFVTISSDVISGINGKTEDVSATYDIVDSNCN